MKYPPEIDAILDQLGSDVAVVGDDSYVIDWIGTNFPFPRGGSTVDWTAVPSSQTISVNLDDFPALRAAFESLIRQVGARDEDSVFVFWHSPHLPTLSMSLLSCRKVFELIDKVPGQEMHIASPDEGWYLEFDPFFDECHGGRVPVFGHQQNP